MRFEKIKTNKYRLSQSEQERAEVILWASIAAGKRGHSENITSPAGKRSSVGDSGAMNTTPLSVIQEVLFNKKEGKKSKFTVEFKESEENGKSRVRIDIWEVDEKTPVNDGTIGQSVQALTRDSFSFKRNDNTRHPVSCLGMIRVRLTGP